MSRVLKQRALLALLCHASRTCHAVPAKEKTRKAVAQFNGMSGCPISVHCFSLMASKAFFGKVWNIVRALALLLLHVHSVAHDKAKRK